MDVKYFNNLKELATYSQSLDEPDLIGFLSVVDLFGKAEWATVFLPTHDWREAVNSFFNAVSDDIYLAPLRDSIVQSCENGVFRKSATGSRLRKLDWGIEPYNDGQDGGLLVSVSTPKNADVA